VFKIYVDFDDVIAETARNLADLLRREYGRKVQYKDIKYFDLKRSFHLSEAEYHQFMERAHEADVLVDLDETPDACGTLLGWLDDGLEPIVVTGRPASSYDETRAWLDKRGLTDLAVIHLDKYGRNLGPPNPAVSTLRIEDIRQMQFDLAIDDAPEALDLLAESRLCPIVIYGRPWNRDYQSSVRDVEMQRVTNWRELDRLVRSRLELLDSEDEGLPF